MTRPPAGAALPILAVGLFRHFEPLMGKLFELASGSLALRALRIAQPLRDSLRHVVTLRARPRVPKQQRLNVRAVPDPALLRLALHGTRLRRH